MGTVITGPDNLGICILCDEKLPERPKTVNMDIAAMSCPESSNRISSQGVGGRVEEKGERV
jgi:hypothetical protein